MVSSYCYHRAAAAVAVADAAVPVTNTDNFIVLLKACDLHVLLVLSIVAHIIIKMNMGKKSLLTTVCNIFQKSYPNSCNINTHVAVRILHSYAFIVVASAFSALFFYTQISHDLLSIKCRIGGSVV